MLYYDRIDLSEGIDVAKSNNRKGCTICHCWYFKHVLKFQKSVCHVCHYMLILSLDIRDVSTITVESIDYRFNISDISKSNAIHLHENVLLDNRNFI